VTFRQALQKMHHAKLEPHSLATRMVYLLILEQGEKQYSTRAIGAELGITLVTAKNSLDTLLEAGLIQIIQPSAGSRPAQFRAIEL
jgi:predicted ArsR family transcriptional regulator